MGQMSDPNYLEKLPMLYYEFREGGVPGYASARDLIVQTPAFFEDFVMKLLSEDFRSVYRFAGNHFKDRNPYIEGINRNLAQLTERYPCESGCPQL